MSKRATVYFTQTFAVDIDLDKLANELQKKPSISDIRTYAVENQSKTLIKTEYRDLDRYDEKERKAKRGIGSY